MARAGGSISGVDSADTLMEGGIATASAVAPVPTRRSKLKISIEKKIENIWLEAEELGWSYNDFVAYFIEVLVVLNHRRTPSPHGDASEGKEKSLLP